MNILLEGSVFSKQVANGISNYASKLIAYSINQVETDLSYTVLVTKGFDQNIFIRDLAPPSSLFTRISNAAFLRKIALGFSSEGIRLFHSPYMFMPPRSTRFTNLLTVHDMINFRRSASVRNHLRRSMLAMAINRADAFICISENTRNQLLEIFPAVDRQTVYVIHQGVDQSFFGPAVNQQHPGKHYILYVGQRADYKNFVALVNFYKDSRWKNELDIVCVGGGRFTETEVKTFQRLNITGNIRHAGFVDNDALRGLYQNAFVLAYTSLEEGFGLPILEAMASGCPVICGNFSSMKEVAGGHAILVNDFSPDSLNVAFERAAQFMSSQRELAKQFARDFTWENTARKTFELYKRLS